MPGLPPVQYWYLALSGGLTTPAMWPEPPSTKRTGPRRYFEPRYVVFHGAMWSSRVEIRQAGTRVGFALETLTGERAVLAARVHAHEGRGGGAHRRGREVLDRRADPHVVHVGREHHVLVPQRGVAPLEDPDHVRRERPAVHRAHDHARRLRRQLVLVGLARSAVIRRLVEKAVAPDALERERAVGMKLALDAVRLVIAIHALAAQAAIALANARLYEEMKGEVERRAAAERALRDALAEVERDAMPARAIHLRTLGLLDKSSRQDGQKRASQRRRHHSPVGKIIHPRMARAASEVTIEPGRCNP